MTIDDQDWDFEKPWIEARRIQRRWRGSARSIRSRSTSRSATRRRRGTASSAVRCRRSSSSMPTRSAPRSGIASSPGSKSAATASPRPTRCSPIRLSPRRREYVGPSGFGLWDRLAALRRAADARSRRRGAAQDAVGRLEPRRSRDLHLGLRRGRLVPLPHRPHPGPAAGAGALPAPLSGQEGDGNAEPGDRRGAPRPGGRVQPPGRRPAQPRARPLGRRPLEASPTPISRTRRPPRD